MRKYRLITLVLLVMLLMPVVNIVQAQGSGGGPACIELVDTVLAALGTNCAGLTPNTACYGYAPAEAQVFDEFVETLPEGFFTAPGDWSDLLQIETLIAGQADLPEDFWGVVALYTQTSIPVTEEGDTAVFVLLGETTLTNNVLPEDAVDVADDEGENTAFQSFTLSLGEDDNRCKSAITGLLMQLPDVNEVRLTGNEADLVLTAEMCTSAIFRPVTTGPDKENKMKLEIISGQVTLFSDTPYAIPLTTGYEITLNLDDDGLFIVPENQEEKDALVETIEVMSRLELDTLAMLEDLPLNVMSCPFALPYIGKPSGVGGPEWEIIPGVDVQ